MLIFLCVSLSFSRIVPEIRFIVSTLFNYTAITYSRTFSLPGNDNFKARDLLEIILDAREQEPEMTGACNVLDCQDEADDVEEEEDDTGN